jgi:hypothetical protein
MIGSIPKETAMSDAMPDYRQPARTIVEAAAKLEHALKAMGCEPSVTIMLSPAQFWPLTNVLPRQFVSFGLADRGDPGLFKIGSVTFKLC